MIKKVFSMNDRLTGFMNIFFEDNVDVAKRGFAHALMSAPADSLFLTNPGDYSLYQIGDFDTVSGVFTPSSVPEFIMRGAKHED